MLEGADIIRRHGVAYRAQYPLLPSQKRALQDIEACRTAYFGGQLKQCDECGGQVYAYHSCCNRHCPKCHGDQTERWLAQQQPHLLPCPYFLVTFTLPAELRPLAFAHQKIVYGLMMRCAAAALQKLALDPQYLGGKPAALAVLHTWTRDLRYHPHVHFLVTGGALAAAGQAWRPTRYPAYLMPAGALADIFLGKLCDALNSAGLLAQVPRLVWKKDWVVNCRAAGSGQQVLKYLARYVFRIAITNSRLERIDHDAITFRYRDNRTQQLHHATLTGVEFIRRFLLHTLPRGFAKVRYYGLWSPTCRPQLEQARSLLSVTTEVAQVSAAADSGPDSQPPEPRMPKPAACPYCHRGHLLVLRLLPPQRKVPP